MTTRLAAVAGFGLALALSGCGGASLSNAAEGASLDSTTCDDLANEAVKISEKEDVQLLKVRAPKVKKDNRKGFAKPTGDNAAVALSCAGTGVWSDGENSPVLLSLEVDADGDQFVYYEAK